MRIDYGNAHIPKRTPKFRSCLRADEDPPIRQDNKLLARWLLSMALRKKYGDDYKSVTTIYEELTHPQWGLSFNDTEGLLHTAEQENLVDRKEPVSRIVKKSK